MAVPAPAGARANASAVGADGAAADLKGYAITTTWAELNHQAVALRHELHRHPELTWAEHETARRVRDVLTQAGIPWRICADTGTIGTLAPHAKGRHIALRADIDALPINEASGLPFTSQNAGCMHACGHDGHTAALVAAAWWLKQYEDQLPGPVSLFFQPAEEGGHGAKAMIEDGALKGVDAIFGWHNWPNMPLGKAVCPDGVVMAGNGTFTITVKGHGGHSSQPELCRDPVLAAAAITTALQQIVSRRLPPQEAAVVSVTSIDARSHPTIVPEQAILGGSIRVTSNATRQFINQLIAQIAQDIARSHGVEADVEIKDRYQSTYNDPAEAARYRQVLDRHLGPDWACANVRIPIMGSEDFSYYLQQIPGAFALIGQDDLPAHAVGLHNPRYAFNDALIPRVARFLIELAGAPSPQ